MFSELLLIFARDGGIGGAGALKLSTLLAGSSLSSSVSTELGKFELEGEASSETDDVEVSITTDYVHQNFNNYIYHAEAYHL